MHTSVPLFPTKHSTEILRLRWATSDCRNGPNHIAELRRIRKAIEQPTKVVLIELEIEISFIAFNGPTVRKP